MFAGSYVTCQRTTNGGRSTNPNEKQSKREHTSGDAGVDPVGLGLYRPPVPEQPNWDNHSTDKHQMQTLLRSLVTAGNVFFVALARKMRVEELANELSNANSYERKANQIVLEVIDRFENLCDGREKDV